MKKILKVIAIIFFGAMTTVFFKNLFLRSNGYLTATKIIEKIDREKDDTIYIEFEDDEIIYEYIEVDNISCDYVLSKINLGDEVEIIIENNAGSYTYTIIQALSINDELIYDTIEYYKNHDRNLAIISITLVISLHIFYTICVFVDLEKKNTEEHFTIRMQKIYFVVLGASLLIGIVAPIVFTVLFIMKLMPYQTYMFSYLFYLFTVFGGLGILILSRAKVTYDGEKYIFYSVFKKRIVYPNEIGCFLIDKTKSKKLLKGGLMAKNDEIIYPMSPDLIYWLGEDYFVRSLINNNVQFYQLIIDKDGKEVKTEFDINELLYVN